MKKKKYERLLKKAGKYAILEAYYGLMKDYPWDPGDPRKTLYESIWKFYHRKFIAIARRADVLDRVFG